MKLNFDRKFKHIFKHHKNDYDDKNARKQLSFRYNFTLK